MAKKIFQLYVGFSLCGLVVWTIYYAASHLYGILTGADQPPGVIPYLPRLGIALSIVLPGVATAWLWRKRRYASIGAFLLGLVALAFWLLESQTR